MNSVIVSFYDEMFALSVAQKLFNYQEVYEFSCIYIRNISSIFEEMIVRRKPILI